MKMKTWAVHLFTSGGRHASVDRDGLPERHAQREARGHRGGALQRGRGIRERPVVFCRRAARGAPLCGRRRLDDRPVPTLPRLRRRSGREAQAQPRPRRTQVRSERAARRGLKVGYEALSWGTHVRTFDRAWRIVSRADHPHLGLILDSFHTLALPDDWSGIADLPGERIFFVQLADAPRLGMNTLTLSRHFRSLPGQGDLDVPAFMQSVLAAGYNGTISLEIFSDDMRAAPPRQTANDAMRSLL